MSHAKNQFGPLTKQSGEITAKFNIKIGLDAGKNKIISADRMEL